MLDIGKRKSDIGIWSVEQASINVRENSRHNSFAH